MNITEQTIQNLVDNLESAINHIKNKTNPSKQWLNDMDWLMYDVRTSMNNVCNYNIDGLCLTSEAEAIEKENERLKGKISDLEDEIDDLTGSL